MTRMKKKYVEEVAPALMEKFQYKSVMQIPKIDKIVVSVGCGDCKDNAKALDNVIKEISAITGQHAVATVARKSVANFNAFGLKEQIIFPEIDYDKIEKLRGMNIAITTTAQTDEEARELLRLMGAPFAN